MNSYGYEHQSAARGGQQYRWMIALLVGVGLGVLLVGPIGGQRWFVGGRGDRTTIAQRSEQQGRATIPDTTQQQRELRQADPRPREGDARGSADQVGAWGPRGGRSGGLFDFGQRELFIPLLLIGAGAWLIWGRRRGPGSSGGSGQIPRPVGPVEPTPGAAHHPETGETRRL